MARSIETIKQEIVAEKNKYYQLSGLNNTATTSLWNLWAFVVASVLYLQETVWDLFKLDLQEIADRAIGGTPKWYEFIALQFQESDLLIWDENLSKFVYAVEDDSKKIVSKAAVREASGAVVQIKVAKEESGTLAPLSASQLTSFSSYMGQLKFAGTFLSIISADADSIKLDLKIFYNGIIALSELQEGVNTSVNNYLLNLPFDGVFRITSLVDAIQQVQGVEDVQVNSVEAKSTLSDYETVEVSYVSYSGYMQVDSAFPLNSVIQYEAII